MKRAVEATRPPKDQRASIAVDLGAESCRVSLLRWIDGRPQLTLVHRFPNAPVLREGSLRWPLRTIEEGVDEGMRQCAALAPEGVRSVAVDGWAVDYVRTDTLGRPLDEPFCYRDERTLASEKTLHQLISPERMRALTGVQQLRLNTLYQLYADKLSGLPTGEHWLNLPEYMLTRWGAKPVAEYTNATHTQLVDLKTRAWCPEIFEAAGVSIDRAPQMVLPGTLLGRLSGPLSELPAFRETELIAPACHDTASAIAGIPAHGEDWGYISSGTWSLVGTLTQRSYNDAEVRQENFTNLGAVGGAFCFQKNVNGMWLIKQCMEAWSAAGADWTFDDLLLRAAQVPAPAGVLDVDAPDLLLVGQMPQRINAQLQKQGLAQIDESPANAPAFASLILHSLAARYHEVLQSVQKHTGKHLQRLFIVGGGSRNLLLNRLTADVTGLRVICGAAESSTIGNLATQLAALEDSDASVSASFAQNVARWATAIHPLND